MDERRHDEHAAALARSSLLSTVGEDDLRALVRASATRRYQPRETIFQRGDPGDGLFVIVSGEVRVTIAAATQGTDMTVATLGAGDVLGELSVLDHMRRSATAVAVTEVASLYVSSADVQAWLREHPDAARSILAGLARRLRATDEQLGEIALLNVESRLAHRIVQLFEQAQRGGMRPGTRLRVNQVQLASSIGVTRESVNKHLAQLKARGIIENAGGYVTVLDAQALRALVEPL